MRITLVTLLLFISCVSQTPQYLNPKVEEPHAVVSECGIPLLLIDEGMGSGQIDIDNMKVAEKRCGKLYKNSPCLRVFRVIGKRQYYAICGEKI